MDNVWLERSLILLILLIPYLPGVVAETADLQRADLGVEGELPQVHLAPGTVVRCWPMIGGFSLVFLPCRDGQPLRVVDPAVGVYPCLLYTSDAADE